MNKREHIKDIINFDWNENTIISLWNEICNGDDMVFENNDEFLDNNFSRPSDAVRAVLFGDYRYNDKLVAFNGYANLVSFNGWSDYDSPIDEDTIVDWLIENGDSRTNETIDSDILCDNFVEDYVYETKADATRVAEIITEYIEEEDFDFLMNDWDELKQIVDEKLK